MFILKSLPFNIDDVEVIEQIQCQPFYLMEYQKQVKIKQTFENFAGTVFI